MQVEAADNCGDWCQANQLLLPGPSVDPAAPLQASPQVVEPQPGSQLVALCLQLSLSHKVFQMLPPAPWFLTDDIEGLLLFFPQYFLRLSLPLFMSWVMPLTADH